MNLTALAGILSLAQSGFAVAEQYGSVAPKLVQGAEDVISAGKTVANDIGGIIANIKAGKYGETEQGIAQAMTDVGQVVSGLEAEIAIVAGVVAKSPTLPTLSGLASALKAL